MDVKKKSISAETLERCAWCLRSEEEIVYHDSEWGVPVTDDQKHFEFLILDAFQAGLSWTTVLRKREAFRKAFAHFDPHQVARFTAADTDRLMLDESIIRNRLKIHAAVTNAQAFLAVQKEFGSFNAYIWQFTKGKTLHRKKGDSSFRATSAESDAMSRDLKKRGFKFVGSTICYAYMQAAGLVNDHQTGCYRYAQLK